MGLEKASGRKGPVSRDPKDNEELVMQRVSLEILLASSPYKPNTSPL